MPRPGSTPPADVEVIGYADATSSPVPLRGTAYAADYPAPPDATVTVYRDEFGAIRYSDRSFTDLVEAAFDRHKAREREGPKPPAHTYSGRIFDLPAAPASETELAYQEQVRRVEEVRRQRPELSVAEALVEVERYGAGEPQTAAPTPAPADRHVEHCSADRIAQVRRRLSNLDFIIKDPAHAYQAHAEKAALLERYGSHLGGKDRSENPGVCVAFWVPSKAAKLLAIPGAVPANDMHVTLAYLGRRSNFTDWELDSIASVVRQVAAEFPPMAYAVTGSGSFPASDSSDGKDVVFAKVESEDVMGFRRHLVARLADAGFVADDKHGKYVPHVTAAYIKPGSHLPELEVKGGRIEVPAREVVLAIGDTRKTFALSGKRELYSATIARARKVLYGLAAARYSSTGSKGPQGSMGLFQDEGREPTPMHVPPLKGSPAHMPSVSSSTSGRTAPTPASAPAAATAEKVRKGLAALRKNRRRRRPYEVPGNGRIPPTPEPTLVRSPRKPPAGSGPARAEVPIPTAAPAEKPPVFLTATPVPRPSAPAPAPVRNPAGLPSQARPDRTTDVSVPRPTPAITNNPAPTLGPLPTTQPPGFATPGQPVRGTVARQNTATPSQIAAKKIWESVFPPGDSIGGRESRSGLQMQPGSAGLKPVTNPAPPVSGLPRQTRSEKDRARDGSNAII